MNNTILLGRLTNKPELRTTPNGKSVAKFSIATNESYTDGNGERKQITDFHNVVAWGRQAEVIEQYCEKGAQLLVRGRSTTRSYEDKDGNKRYIHEVILKDFEFIGGNKKSEGGESRSNRNEPAEEDEIRIDDIPF